MWGGISLRAFQQEDTLAVVTVWTNELGRWLLWGDRLLVKVYFLVALSPNQPLTLRW